MKRRILSALLVATAAAACSESEAVEAPSFTTTTTSRGDLRITVEATGTVEPIRNLEVKSQASGEILRLHVDVGDQVQPGTLLAEVDPRDVRNAYEQAEADLAVARSRAQIAEQQLSRQEELLEAGVVTQQELETATLEAANAQANLVRSRTNFELAQLRLNDVTIRAPLAGTVLSRNVEEGTVIQSASQNVSGGTVLFVMADLDAMQVRTLVDETDMGRLSAGMPAGVTVEAYPDRTFRGEVEKIEPQAQVEQNVTMFPVIVRLDNRNGLLRPGMNAEVEVLVDQTTDALLVPNTAIVSLQDLVPAAMALGLDPESLDMGQLMAGGGRTARTASAEQGGDSATAGAAAGEAPAAPPTMAELRQQVERGEITRDSVRKLIQARRAAMGGEAGGRGGGDPEVRRAAVFVMNNGIPEPRVIQIGLNDWDNTAVVSGLEGGEELAVVGAAQLRAQAQARARRFTGGGGLPFSNN